MSFFPVRDPEPGDAFSCDAIEMMVIPNARDIGGFEVRRALPTARRRLVCEVSSWPSANEKSTTRSSGVCRSVRLTMP